METESSTTTTTTQYQAVADTHRELVRQESRTAGDWARDGYSLQGAQAAVDKAHADYMAAFTAYAEDRDHYDTLRDSVPDSPEYPHPHHDY